MPAPGTLPHVAAPAPPMHPAEPAAPAPVPALDRAGAQHQPASPRRVRRGAWRGRRRRCPTT